EDADTDRQCDGEQHPFDRPAVPAGKQGFGHGVAGGGEHHRHRHENPDGNGDACDERDECGDYGQRRTYRFTLQNRATWQTEIALPSAASGYPVTVRLYRAQAPGVVYREVSLGASPS
ncbi:MAG: hypothetical protein ACXV5Q_12490, partial [Frankiaceae bacterium]